MIIFPAIDIKDGKCVRLKQGSFEDVTIFDDNPVNVAKRWEESGSKYIHIVDLDAAKNGIPVNIGIIEQIVKSVKIPIQVGGGIRNKETIKMLLELGVDRVILGTAAIRTPELLKDIVNEYEEKIVVSIDAKNELVAIDGWTNISSINSIELAFKLQKIGVKTIVYTDISMDGMMQGPNFNAYSRLKENTDINIIASGGISSIENVVRLVEIGVYGCIIGKALYTGDINLKRLLEV